MFAHTLIGVCLAAQVLAQAPGNAARGKSATQSSTYLTYTADKAVDGNRTNYFWDNSCSHTSKTSNTWWRVDLGEEHVIYSVTIVNRMFAENRLKEFTIRLGNSSEIGVNPVCKSYTDSIPDNATVDIPCEPSPMSGRYISIEMNGNRAEYLALCEVEVPKSYPKPSECGAGTFGPSCNWTCNCLDTDEKKNCFKLHGRCPKGCQAGMSGPDCQDSCKDGTYGSNCPLACHCIGPTSKCDTVTGNGLCTDPNKCQPGWKGPKCTIGNSALGKTASQSSTYMMKSAALAVDGIKLTNIFGENGVGGCTHTNKDNSPWWQLDLGVEHVIHSVTLTNRDIAYGRLRNFTIRIGNQGSQNLRKNPACKVYWGTVPRNVTQNIKCEPLPVPGRYVSIQLNDREDYLTLCEVALPLSYPKAASCPTGKFGPECALTCHCADSKENTTCFNTHGACPKGCDDGWEGPDCQEPCKDGYFGLGCKSKCHCSGAQCDRFNGNGKCTAPNKCEEGWTGDSCAIGNVIEDATGGCKQSSTLYGKAGDCKNAMDKSNLTDFWSYSCTHTDNDTNAWWMVDLGHVAAINYVELLNRGNVDKETANRLNFPEVYVGNNITKIEANALCNRVPKAVDAGESLRIPCLAMRTGRYIWIQKRNPGYLTMCRVIANGFFYAKSCEPGTWGDGCIHQCGKCKGGASCDPLNGQCNTGCDRLYRGQNCDQKVSCPPDWVLIHSTWSSCYKAETTEMTQAQGILKCRSYNTAGKNSSVLVAVETAAENEAIYQWTKGHSWIKNIITSGHCKTTSVGKSCIWLEPSNHPLQFKFWADGEPNDTGPVIQMWKGANYYWDDVPEDTKGHIMCEMVEY